MTRYSDERLDLLDLRSAASTELLLDEVLWTEKLGYAIAKPAGRVERTREFDLHGPQDQCAPLERLRTMFLDPGYTSVPVILGKLAGAHVDLTLSLCFTTAGTLIAETAHVARQIDPALGVPTIIPTGPTTPCQTAFEVATGPVLHCFHRAIGAYGHFVLDGLVVVNLCRDAIRAGRFKILMPSYVPDWALHALIAIGLPEDAFLFPTGTAIQCDQLLILSSIESLTTFFPSRSLCEALRNSQRPKPLRTALKRRRIYLSRANQQSYSQRHLVNEPDVMDLLATRGFEILEPGNMSFREQILAFAEADVIVGAHGSAFGNLVFAEPDTAVIDLMPADWIGYWGSEGTAERWLLHLTGALHLSYDIIICQSELNRVLSEGDRSGLQKFGMNSKADLDVLARVLHIAERAGLRSARKIATSAIANAETDCMIDGRTSEINAPRSVQSRGSFLDILCDSRLDPLFRLPDRRGTNSAWWGHIPFAAWLVRAARPLTFVELGSFSGVSYSAFCQAVLAEQLSCACHAVDTWQGDPHAGHYDDSVYEEFKQYHDDRYKAISTLHRCTFDDALRLFSDGSIDILHIDGFHTYEAVKHDFETWLPKMSARGVVLFHDANERMADFGVWRFWDEIVGRWPSFLFLHSHGLGVLAVGTRAPTDVLALCHTEDPSRIATLRERFGLIGYAQAQWDVAAARALAAESAIDRRRGRETQPRAIKERTESDIVFGRYNSVVEAELKRLRRLERRLRAIAGSLSWRATSVLRAVGSRFPRLSHQLHRGARLLWQAASQKFSERLVENHNSEGCKDKYPSRKPNA